MRTDCIEQCCAKKIKKLFKEKNRYFSSPKAPPLGDTQVRRKDKTAGQNKIKILFIPGSFVVAHAVRLLVLAKTLDTEDRFINFINSI